MNIEYAKKLVSKHINKRHVFSYTGSRNQVEEFTGKIIKLYSAIFIIELEDGTIKSFTYSDFVINNLKIIS